MKILVQNAFIITQNKKREVISNGFIVIDGQKIKAIGNGFYKKKEKRWDKIINAKNFIILPGLVNAHVHLGESVYADFFNRHFNLKDYLEATDEINKRVNWIEEKRDDISDYSLLNLLKNGNTTICGGRTIDQAERWGIRNVSGYMLMKSSKLKKFLNKFEKKYKKEYQKIRGTELSYIGLFIHSLNYIDLILLKRVKKVMQDYPETRLILHVAETKNQEIDIQNKFAKSSIKILYRNGLLNKRTILIHGNWIGEKDLALVKRSGSAIVHCLSSNFRVADKVLDLQKIIRKKIRTCLATDGVVTSGTFNLFDEGLKCYKYHKKLSYQKILDLITIDAADVLGLKKMIGSVEVGKRADLIFLKVNKKNEDLFREMFKNGVEICGLIINGNIKIWNKKILQKNEKRIVADFNNIVKKMKKEMYESSTCQSSL